MRDISRMGAAGFTALGVILPRAPSFLAPSRVNPGKAQEGYEGHFRVEIPPSRALARRKLRQTQPQVLIKINHCPQLLDTITRSPGINSTDGECN